MDPSGIQSWNVTLAQVIDPRSNSAAITSEKYCVVRCCSLCVGNSLLQGWNGAFSCCSTNKSASIASDQHCTKPFWGFSSGTGKKWTLLSRGPDPNQSLGFGSGPRAVNGVSGWGKNILKFPNQLAIDPRSHLRVLPKRGTRVRESMYQTIPKILKFFNLDPPRGVQWTTPHYL